MFLCKSLNCSLSFVQRRPIFIVLYSLLPLLGDGTDIALSLFDIVNNTVDTKKLHLLSIATTLPRGIEGGSSKIIHPTNKQFSLLSMNKIFKHQYNTKGCLNIDFCTDHSLGFSRNFSSLI